MTFLDVVQVVTGVMVSLGGGGAIVAGFSGFLGRLWADRALEDHKQEYARLNQQMQHDHDEAMKRLQVQLDAIGLVHNLRIKEEFPMLTALWKKVAAVRVAADKLALLSLPLDEQHHDETQGKFDEAEEDFQKFVSEEMIFAPHLIAQIARTLAEKAQGISFSVMLNLIEGDVKARKDTWGEISGIVKEFNEGCDALEYHIRKHTGAIPAVQETDQH